MKSANFEILCKGSPAPGGLGGFAEAYVHVDPCFERPAPNHGEPTQ
jgi:hypothetical protein